MLRACVCVYIYIYIYIACIEYIIDTPGKGVATGTRTNVLFSLSFSTAKQENKKKA